LQEHQAVTVSAPADFDHVDIHATVIAVEGGEALLHVIDDPSVLFRLPSRVDGCWLAFVDRGRPVALRGYLETDWSTLRFGVSDGVTVPEDRMHARLRRAVTVDLRPRERAGRFDVLTVVTEDISRGGFSTRTGALSTGERYRAVLFLPGGSPILAGCRVVRGSATLAALAWDDLDAVDARRIAGYVLDEKRRESMGRRG
jgi:hypothetical protein